MKPIMLAVALAVAWLLPAPVFAADGDPDPSFGGIGVAGDPVDGYARAHAVVIQSDGKIVAAGETATTFAGPFSMALVRFKTDGTFDTDFDTDGRVSGTVPNAAVDLVAQPDGTLVALAFAGSDLLLARFEDDGTLDASFGTAGVATVDCGPPVAGTATLVRQPDGKLVAAAPSNSGATCVVRALTDGSPDPSFGTNGVVTVPDLYAWALAIQPDGKVLTGGRNNGTGVLTVARLLPDGTLDGGFGSKGLAVNDLGPLAYATGLAVEPNGRVVASVNIVGDGRDFGVARFTAKGKPDTSFGTDGIAVTTGPDGFFSTTSDVVLQPDGKIVIVGDVTQPGPPFPIGNSQLARYDIDGSLDPTFGTGGIASGGGSGEAIRLQPDGKVVTVGSAPLGPDSSLVVSRFFGLTIDCPAAAAMGCAGTTAPAASSLKLDGVKDRLQWKWGKGAETMPADFGDPTTTAAYSLCLYDESVGSTLVDGANVPAGGTCAGKPCWKAKGTTGFAYKDKLASRFGIAAIKLKAGVAGKAQLQVSGQGSALPTPGLPVVTLPLRLQLNGNGHCWEAVFTSSGASRNDGERFQGKSQ